MENRFLNFFKRYYILMILSLVHPLAMTTTKYWGRIIITRTNLGPFRTYDFYLFCFVPISYLIYGCITYIITKKIFIPNAIPTVIFFIYFCIFHLKNLDFSTEKFHAILFFTLFPIVFSILSTLLTAGFYTIRRAMQAEDD